MDNSNWFSHLDYHHWAPLSISSTRPSARYKHAAAVYEDKLYVYGGIRNGRYLSDLQVLDLITWEWRTLNLLTVGSSEDLLPPSSDHSMLKWGDKLLILGGHSKNSSDTMIVRYFDLNTHSCGVIETSGKAPVARGGHSATLVGSRVIIFGGEDKLRKLRNDVYVLNLETMTWDILQTTQRPPAPRFDHSAAINAGRYLLIFGGCSHSIFFSDLHVLDLQTMEWSQPEIQGESVTPRAGHASVTIDEMWYIVGGGDNKNGCSETIVFNMSKLVWSTLTSVKQRDPLASEGLSVCSAVIDGEKHLVGFGGYNGKYNNEVFVMRLKPRDVSRPKIFQSPAAAAAAASVSAAYALAKSEKLDFPNIELASKVGKKPSEGDLKFEIEHIKEEQKVLELSVAEARAENSRLREKIDEVNGTHTELTKEFHSVQGQLVSERSRCFKLEAQIAELQKMLESLQSIDDEVQLLRRQKSALDQEIELNASIQKQNSGGVWRWIAG